MQTERDLRAVHHNKLLQQQGLLCPRQTQQPAVRQDSLLSVLLLWLRAVRAQ